MFRSTIPEIELTMCSSNRYSKTLVDPPGTCKLLNQRYQFPISFVGSDQSTYILDQFADADGIFRLHVLKQKSKYVYDTLYDGNPFMLKGVTD